MMATLRRSGLAISLRPWGEESFSADEGILQYSCVSPGARNEPAPLTAAPGGAPVGLHRRRDNRSRARSPNCWSSTTFSAYCRAAALRDVLLAPRNLARLARRWIV